MSKYEAKYEVVDAKPSTPAEKIITQNLQEYFDDVAPLEVRITRLNTFILVLLISFTYRYVTHAVSINAEAQNHQYRNIHIQNCTSVSAFSHALPSRSSSINL